MKKNQKNHKNNTLIKYLNPSRTYLKKPPSNIHTRSMVDLDPQVQTMEKENRMNSSTGEDLN